MNNSQAQTSKEILFSKLQEIFSQTFWTVQETSVLSAIAYGEIPVSNGKAEVDIWFVGKNAGCLIQINNEPVFAIADRENKTLEECLSQIQETLSNHGQQTEEFAN